MVGLLDPITLGLVLGAATLGIIVAVMEQGEFPGWGKMILCVLAGVIPAAIIGLLLRPLFLVGLAVGAVSAGFAIARTCGMGVKRAIIAAAVGLGIQAAITAVFWLVAR